MKHPSLKATIPSPRLCTHTDTSTTVQRSWQLIPDRTGRPGGDTQVAEALPPASLSVPPRRAPAAWTLAEGPSALSTNPRGGPALLQVPIPQPGGQGRGGLCHVCLRWRVPA